MPCGSKGRMAVEGVLLVPSGCVWWAFGEDGELIN